MLCDLIAEKDIFADRHGTDQAQFLIDDGNTGLLTVFDTGIAFEFPVHVHLALVFAGRVDAANTFIGVDFPAPFSPTRMDLPRFTQNVTSSKAFTPGNSFVIFCIRKI